MKIKIPSKPTNKPALTPTDDIKQRYVDYRRSMSKLDEVANEAFDRMYLFGVSLIENEDFIKSEYGPWSRFAKEEGIDKYAISRCRSSVLDFYDLGANNVDQARELVKARGLKPTAKLMEGNIRRQLESGDNKSTPKDNSVKREKDINEIRKHADRIHELVEEHDPDDELYQEAVELLEFAENSVAHVQSIDVSQKNWNNESYLNFCRNINYDAVLGKPVKKSEPMHIAPDGGSGSMGGKVADFYAIPGSRDTHNKLHSGDMKLTYEEIADLHRWTMIQFILHHIPSDKATKEIENIPETEYEEE